MDVDMFPTATLGNALLSLMATDENFSYICKIHFALQILVGSPSGGISVVSAAQSLRLFAALTPQSPRVCRKACIDDIHDAWHLVNEHMGGAHCADRRDLKSGPCFLGSVPQVLHDDRQYWYCVGRVQTARVFCDDTFDQQPPVSPVKTEHPFLQWLYFKAEVFKLARTIS